MLRITEKINSRFPGLIMGEKSESSADPRVLVDMGDHVEKLLRKYCIYGLREHW